MSSGIDYSKWAKLAIDVSSSDDEDDGLRVKMDPTFAKRYMMDKLMQDKRIQKRQEILQKKAEKLKPAPVPKLAPAPVPVPQKVQPAAKPAGGTSTPLKGRRQNWHDPTKNVRDTRWDNLEVSSSEDENANDPSHGAIAMPPGGVAEACQMLLDTGRRELPPEMRWGEVGPSGKPMKKPERSQEVDDLYRPLRERLEKMDISSPLKNSDKAKLNTPFMRSYQGTTAHSQEIRITPLCYAIQRKDTKFVEWLLKNGAKPTVPENFGDEETGDGWYPLHWACRMGDVDILTCLLENGGKETVNILSPLGIPAISIAMRNGFIDCVKILIEAKADVNTGVVTPLTVFMVKMRTVEKAGGKAEIDLLTLKLLLDAGSELDIELDKMPLGFKHKTTLRMQLEKASEGFANRKSFLNVLKNHG